MPIQFAKHAKQPGETETGWSIEYLPGRNMAMEDSLTGNPTVRCYEIASPVNTAAIEETTSTMIEGVTRNGNVVLWRVKGGASGKYYKCTITCDTALGGVAVEEEIGFAVQEL